LRLLLPFAAALLGIAHAAAFAPWDLPWLQVLALAALFMLAERAGSARRAALAGFAFGLGWFALGIGWVYISMHRYGPMPAWQAGPATAAFVAFLALYPALALGLAHRFVRTAASRFLLGLPACWVLSEWLRGVLLTGFPWLAAGYAHADGPLAGYAPVLGVYGVTLIAAAMAGQIAAALTSRRLRTIAAMALAIGALLLGGQALRAIEWTQPEGKPVAVRLVQGDVPQDEKFTDDSLQRAIDTFGPLMNRPGRSDLVVLPESVFPLPLEYLPVEVLDGLKSYTRTTGAALVFGVFVEPAPDKYFNSAVALLPDGSMQRYSKRHLVPFGEFIPWGFRWFVDLMNMPIGDQQHGRSHQPPLDLAGQRVAMNICYEDLFGAEILDAFSDPQRQPTLLANISNLAWFDDSIALPQHLQIARMRSLETGRPTIRATNTGATAIIDAHGRLTAQLPILKADVLDGIVQGRSGSTPFIVFGNAPALVLAAALLAAGWFWSTRRPGHAYP
jgi:apolipoprotein N-acyltransferase